MVNELKETLEKHLFNCKWGDPDGRGRKTFPATDIRCGDFQHNDFTLRASNLEEAVAKLEKGNFVICSQDPGMFTASGCPPEFSHATLGLNKAEQKGGTGGEDDWTKFHAKAPWQMVFQHENKSITWNLVEKAHPSSTGNVKDGLNKDDPCMSGSMRWSTDVPSPKQHLMKNPLKAGRKERERIRRAAKDPTMYLVGDPHKRSGGGESPTSTSEKSKDGEKSNEEEETVQTNGTREEKDCVAKKKKRKDRHKGRKEVKTKEQNTKMQPKRGKRKYLHLQAFLERRRWKRRKCTVQCTLDLMAKVTMMMISKKKKWFTCWFMTFKRHPYLVMMFCVFSRWM